MDSEYASYIGTESSWYRIVIPFPKVAWFTVALPFFGFIFCVCWSITYNFDHATFTHCQVYNFLPSVSAAIGHYKPQNDVWRVVIAFQALIRLFVFAMYYHYYKETVHKWAKSVSDSALACYVIENISLVTLSFWTSNESYVLHKFSFIIFLIVSLMHMSLTCYIWKSCRNSLKDSVETKSYTLKIRALVLNAVSIILACYFFWRHNKYCEPFVYSMFALSEYMVVLTNMGFHVTAAWDFSGRSLLISTKSIRII